MKKCRVVYLVASLLIWCLLPTTNFFAQSYQWAFNAGSPTDDEGNDIATDGNGNVYVTGNFEGTVDFDPGAGIANLISTGVKDIFVAKYNAAGTYQWAFNIGGAASDRGIAIATDGSANVYVTGYFQGPADFDPGAGIANLTSAGSSDIFVAKYNAAGIYQWAFKVGSPVGDQGNGIAIDPGTSDVYVTGYFTTAADFDPGAGIANLVSASAGIPDIFVTKYNSAGTYQWAFRLGAASGDEGHAIATDGNANVYVTGIFQGTTDFDPGAGTANCTSVGVYDVFVAKYNAAGIYQWAFNAGSASTDFGHAIATDGNANVYITGYFAGTADFDPGAGTANLISAGAQDIYIAKYNTAGIYQWAFNAGLASADVGYALVTDANANVYVTGGFEGTVDFDPGAGTANLTSVGSADIFVAIYNSAGAYQCAFNVGSISGEYGGYGIDLDPSAAIYMTGSFQSTADFDPGAGTANLTSAGGYDMYVAKYTGCFSSMLTVNASSTNLLCNSQCNGTATGSPSGGTPGYTYSWNTLPAQTTQTATGLCAGTYTITVTDATGGTVSATVTITEPPLLITSVPSITNVSCNGMCTGTATVNGAGGSPAYTYSWNTVPVQNSASATGLCAGNYTATVVDANNCITTQTTVITEPAAITASVSSTSATCGNNDGSAMVNANGGTGTLTYLWAPSGGNSANATGLAAGNYTITVTDANGCTHTQTVAVASNGGFTLNTSSTPAECTLTNGTAMADPSNGTTPYTYNWSNGQITQTATGLATGNYTVTVTDASGCLQTQTISVTQTPGPTAFASAVPTSIAPGTSSTLTATGGNVYQWSPSAGLNCVTCANPIASPLQTTSYCVIVTDTNGCSDSDCITITVDLPCGTVYIPNAFSPNNDGENEMECVIGNCIQTLHLIIYNRWGEKVFSQGEPLHSKKGNPSSEEFICWDGTHNGQQLNTAVFVYYMEATLTNGEKIIQKGNISLIR